MGVSHHDYYFDPECWFRCNLAIAGQFPEVIFFPSWWAEYGMAIEPTILGGKARFRADQPPGVEPFMDSLDAISSLSSFNVETDGLAPLALHRIRSMRGRIAGAGHVVPAVAARGPLCTASFARGVTNLMMDLIDDPDGVKRLLDVTTRLTIEWLQAQAAAAGDVESIFVLDDIVGFLGEQQYLEFAHPCLKRISDAFPSHWIKVYHNDTNIRNCLPHLADAGITVLNWDKHMEIAEVARVAEDKLCLMGNVNPLETGVRGTPAEVYSAAMEVLRKAPSKRFVLSLGGGTSPGMSRENVEALVAATRDFQSGGTRRGEA
jgi:MtaA/CmuA family methyltransferase